MKRILVGVFALLFAVIMTGCSSYSADVDQTGIEQDGYVFFKTDRSLVECHEAGSSGYGGVGNDMFYYPSGQRTYSFTGASSESEISPIKVVSSDGQTLQFPGFIKFTLTSDCESLYEFHTKVGVKYKAYENEGWNDLLNDYLNVAVDSALSDVASDQTWQALYQDATVRATIEAELLETVQSRINSSLGGEWITVNSVSLSKPAISEELEGALSRVETARLEQQEQLERNEVNETRYASMTDCLNAGLSESACITMHLAERGDIPFYTIPQGGNVNVSPQQPAQ